MVIEGFMVFSPYIRYYRTCSLPLIVAIGTTKHSLYLVLLTKTYRGGKTGRRSVELEKCHKCLVEVGVVSNIVTSLNSFS